MRRYALYRVPVLVDNVLVLCIHVLVFGIKVDSAPFLRIHFQSGHRPFLGCFSVNKGVNPGYDSVESNMLLLYILANFTRKNCKNQWKIKRLRYSFFEKQHCYFSLEAYNTGFFIQSSESRLPSGAGRLTAMTSCTVRHQEPRSRSGAPNKRPEPPDSPCGFTNERELSSLTGLIILEAGCWQDAGCRGLLNPPRKHLKGL